MEIERFTPIDYYNASLLRNKDLKYLRKNEQSIIFSLYCAGVAVECMLRAYITKRTSEFSSKHNLENLYLDSQIATFLNVEEKEKLTIAIKKINKIWRNDLRYTSEKKMTRLIVSKFNLQKLDDIKREVMKDINKNGNKGIKTYIDAYYSDIFDAVDLIIETGEDKWTS